MKKKRLILFTYVSLTLLSIVISTACSGIVSAKVQPQQPQYYSPLENAKLVSKGATVVVRYGPQLSPRDLAALTFTVTGTLSGPHPGQKVLADDQKTVIFKPETGFTPGEQVKVNVSSLTLGRQGKFDPLSYQFEVAANQKPGGVGAQGAPPSNPPKSAFPNFLTLPQDIPHYTFQQDAPLPGEGDIFVAPFYWTKSTVGSYLLIINQQGQLVYYKSMADDLSAFDFKVQPNGMLSYFDLKNNVFHLMDSHYTEVGTYAAGDGYTADLHDLDILPNGDALLMAYDDETVDMSSLAPNGKKDATVTGLIIQELDPSRNVIFEWRSWDHFAITDTTSTLTDPKIDAVHGNALALANDGNLLLSSRNQSEITKINLQTGAVIWRFGGKANMFKLIGGQPFAYQHDVRQLPNGDITLFDNHGSTDKPASSHTLEYKLDEVNMTATVVWDFVHSPPVFGMYMGNVQRLADGNTFLSWGAASSSEGFEFVNITELDPQSKPIFELAFDQPYVSYRAFILPWNGSPTTKPDLASRTDTSGVTLGYSWNGDTQTAKYEIYGGSSPTALKPIQQQARIDFETQSRLTGLPANECYFQVAALDGNGHELARSNVLSTDKTNCP